MESTMVKNLKKLLDGFLTLENHQNHEKTPSDVTQTSSSGEILNKVEDEVDLFLTSYGSISEGTLAQNLPSNNFNPGFRHNTAVQKSKKNFIRKFSDLLSTEQYAEALETYKEQTSKMDSALIEAAGSNNASLCRQLLDRREYGELVAQTNAKDAEGNTPLHLAAMHGHLKVCEILLDYGDNIDKNPINIHKKTPLHLACINNQIPLAQLLVRSGANINALDDLENTPVHYSAQLGSKDLLEWLLSKGPDLTIKNFEGKTAMEINTRESVQEIFKKEPSGSSSPLFTLNKQIDFMGMIQKINNIIRKSPNNSEDFDNIQKLSPGHFRPIKMLGKGSFGEVFLVEKKDTKQLLAMKILMKNKIMGQNLVRYAMTERNVASAVKHPFIVCLRYSFQTDNKLYLLLDYCPGGSLGGVLNREKRFSEERSRIYLCEILLALEELHKRDIIYRDLKPDNVVIDSEGHALLTDFGLSKEGVMEKDSAKSFCGSVAYLAPEILKRAGHGKAVDWYLLGVLLYEMLIGSPPFYSQNRSEMFLNIKKAKLRVPTSLTIECKNLLRDLLQKDPNKRLGSVGGASQIKQHEFFYGIDWNLVYNRGLRPPVPLMPSSVSQYLPEDMIADSQNELNSLLPGWTFIGK
ncbi:hypothetical protein SteCoe_28084 [Stentor coeruleus]|uniref:Protein kinase domain-containing protein n=1 Tax=Stentor coeruleus TaxID=5963 RepID=A0A1R2B906_9CILI|nr:hypothetical protein SteCoe_28084 [Stentor coeruleus]